MSNFVVTGGEYAVDSQALDTAAVAVDTVVEELHDVAAARTELLNLIGRTGHKIPAEALNLNDAISEATGNSGVTQLIVKLQNFASDLRKASDIYSETEAENRRRLDEFLARRLVNSLSLKEAMCTFGPAHNSWLLALLPANIFPASNSCTVSDKQWDGIKFPVRELTEKLINFTAWNLSGIPAHISAKPLTAGISDLFALMGEDYSKIRVAHDGGIDAQGNHILRGSGSVQEVDSPRGALGAIGYATSIGTSALTILGRLTNRPYLSLAGPVAQKWLGLQNFTQWRNINSQEVTTITAPGVATSTAKNLPQLVSTVEKLRSSADEGQIGVHKNIIPATATIPEKTTWTVVVRGTQKWSPGSSNPQDMLTNLEEVGARTSDQDVAVASAMRQAGIKPGETVEFVGHSQGAAVVAKLSSDQVMNAKYNIASAVLVGGPGGGYKPNPKVKLLVIENVDDIVPGLDGKPNSSSATTIHADFKGGYSGVVDEHSNPSYNRFLSENWVQMSQDPRIKSWSEARGKAMGFDEKGVRTESYTFSTKRIPDLKGTEN